MKAEINNKVAGMKAEIKEIDNKVGRIDNKVGGISNKVGGIDNMVGGFEKRFGIYFAVGGFLATTLIGISLRSFYESFM